MLNALPEKLFLLNAEANHFHGTLCLLNLPPLLAELTLNNNMFKGPLNLSSIPLTLTSLNLNGNLLNGIVDLSPVLGESRKGAPPLLLQLYGNEFESYLLPPSIAQLPDNVQYDEPMALADMYMMG